MTIIETTPETLPWHLRGNWAPVLNEVADNALFVEGSIPPELDGLYERTGPNPKSGTSPHWFLRRWHGPRCADLGRSGRVVPKSLRADP